MEAPHCGVIVWREEECETFLLGLEVGGSVGGCECVSVLGYVCLCVYICVFVCVCVWVCVSVYMFMYDCVSICMSEYLSVLVSVCK